MGISPIGCDDSGVIKEMADIWKHGNQLQKTKKLEMWSDKKYSCCL